MSDNNIVRDSSGVAHIVALSGGKDSTALALRLSELGEFPLNYVCTPTGDELPELLKHWGALEELLGQPIIQIRAETDLDGLIAKYKALPNHRMRWCTRILKIKPYEQFCKSIGNAVSYVGLRSDEGSRVGAIYSDEITQKHPFKEWGWGISEVLEYLLDKGVSIPKRTDCARCYHQRLYEWWELWKFYPAIYESAAGQESAIGHTFRSSQRDTWPASLEGMRLRFEAGELPRGVELTRDFWQQDNVLCRACSL